MGDVFAVAFEDRFRNELVAGDKFASCETDGCRPIIIGNALDWISVRDIIKKSSPSARKLSAEEMPGR